MGLGLSRRALVAAFASFAVCAAVVAAPVARAEGEEEMPAEHSAYDMALAEGGMPEGWTLLKSADGAADENALKDAVLALAKEKGAAADKLHFVTRSATAAEGKAVFALIDLDERADAFSIALKDAAAGKGWAFRAMGAPTRLLVVAAPEALRERAVALQSSWAAKMLAVKATSALEARNGPRAVLMAKTAIAIDPKSAGANSVIGRMMSGEAIQAAQHQGEDAPAMLKKAIDMMKLSVSKEATGGLTPGERASTLGELGLTLLYVKTTKADEEARDVLKEAVGLPFDEPRTGIVARYNLACSYGRLKDLDNAFKELTATLEANAKSPVEGIGDGWRQDADFENLKADPRWAELEKKYPATGGDMGGY